MTNGASRGFYVAGVVGKAWVRVGRRRWEKFKLQNSNLNSRKSFYPSATSKSAPANSNPHPWHTTCDPRPATRYHYSNSFWEHCRLNVLLIHSKILSSVWRSRTRVSSIRCSLCDYNPMENWRSIRLWTHGSILPRIQVFPWCSVIATESHEYSAIKGRHQKSSALGRFLHSWHYWIWKWLGMTLPRLTLLWEAYKFSLLSVPTLSYCSG